MTSTPSRICPKCKVLYQDASIGFGRSRLYDFQIWCRKCMSDYSQRYNILNKDKVSKRSKKWYSRNKKRLQPIRRRYDLKRRTNSTPEEYDRLFKLQNGLCAICSKSSSGNLHIDHNHKTGKVRGLLCRDHNLMLGFAGDNCDILLKSVKYLSQS